MFSILKSSLASIGTSKIRISFVQGYSWKLYLKLHYKYILLFLLSWKSFLKKLFLYHWKRKMVIYVLIYFGCVIL